MGSVPWSEKASGNAFFILRANGADGPNKPNEGAVEIQWGFIFQNP